MSDIAILRAQNRLLEEELADVKRERNAFRQELSYYREKAAKYISLADEHGSTIRDLERELERTQKLTKMNEVLLSALDSSEALKDGHTDEKIIDLTDPASMPDSENRVSPSIQPSLEGAVNLAEEHHDTDITILDNAQGIAASNVSPHQRDIQPREDLKRSSDTAQLQNQGDLPGKRPRTRSQDQPDTVSETRDTSSYEDRAGKEGNIVPNDLLEECPSSHDIQLDSTPQLNIDIDVISPSRSPSISHATNVTSSPEIPRVNRIATVQKPASHNREGVQNQTETAVAEASVQDSSSKTADSGKRPETFPKTSPQSNPVLEQEQSSTKPKLMDAENPRDHPDSPVLPKITCAEISLADFHRRQPLRIRPFPDWTSECENITSAAIRRLLGGLTGPGATFTTAKEGRTHLFLQCDNCPFLPLPGEPAVVYVSFPKYVSSDVRVFIHRGGQKSDTMWEYGGEYECNLKLLNPLDFKKENARFRESFVQKFLFEKEFHARYSTDQRLQQSSISMREAELRAIDNGDKTIYVALIECYKYDHDFAIDLVRRCTGLAKSSRKASNSNRGHTRHEHNLDS